MANEPKLKVPAGYRNEFSGTTPIVVCWACKRVWRIPEAMYRTGSLSPNAWALLVTHREANHPKRPRGRALSEQVRRLLPRVGGYDEVG